MRFNALKHALADKITVTADKGGDSSYKETK